MKPRPADLDVLVEFIMLMEKERCDQQMHECLELAYDVAVYLKKGVGGSANPYLQQFKFGERCLASLRAARGEAHAQTRAFEKKMGKDAGV